MKTTLMIAATAASIILPGMASAGDYLQMFEGRPNKTVYFTESAPAHMGQMGMSSQAPTPSHHIQLEPYAAGSHTASTSSYGMQEHQGSSYSASSYSAPSYHGSSSYGGDNAPMATTNHHSSVTMYDAPLTATTSACGKPSCTTFGYAGSGKRYDIYGKRIK